MAPTRPSQPIRLHRFARSGHCHRVELLLSLLELPNELVDVDLARAEQKTPGFLAMNAFGQVPVIEDGDVTLADSNAIVVYLAARYGGRRWTPETPELAAEQQRWLSVAAGPLAFGPAAARAHYLFNAATDIAAAEKRSHALFQLMSSHLSARAFLLGSEPTLADVANYAYVAHAPEGGIALGPYPALRSWLERIESMPRFVAMAKSPDRTLGAP